MTLLKCARCQTRTRESQMTGCLCTKCEKEIEHMTQAELDADYETHRKGERR